MMQCTFLFDLIRLHPQMGYELLSKWDSTRPYAESALYHHLWYDEKGGYPREYTHKGNDNAILRSSACQPCRAADHRFSYTAKSSVKTWSWFYNFGFCLC